MCARPIGSERERRPFAKTSVEGETCLRSRKGRTLEMSSYGDARLRAGSDQFVRRRARSVQPLHLDESSARRLRRTGQHHRRSRFPFRTRR